MSPVHTGQEGGQGDGRPDLSGFISLLVDAVQRTVTIDWTQRESSRAELRTVVRRVLRQHGYPPDKQEKATLTVLEQAEARGMKLAA